MAHLPLHIVEHFYVRIMKLAPGVRADVGTVMIDPSALAEVERVAIEQALCEQVEGGEVELEHVEVVRRLLVAPRVERVVARPRVERPRRRGLRGLRALGGLVTRCSESKQRELREKLTAVLGEVFEKSLANAQVALAEACLVAGKQLEVRAGISCVIFWTARALDLEISGGVWSVFGLACSEGHGRDAEDFDEAEWLAAEVRMQ